MRQALIPSRIAAVSPLQISLHVVVEALAFPALPTRRRPYLAARPVSVSPTATPPPLIYVPNWGGKYRHDTFADRQRQRQYITSDLQKAAVL